MSTWKLRNQQKHKATVPFPSPFPEKAVKPGTLMARPSSLKTSNDKHPLENLSGKEYHRRRKTTLESGRWLSR